jgi:hypothetical protein
VLISTSPTRRASPMIKPALVIKDADLSDLFACLKAITRVWHLPDVTQPHS